MSSQTPLCIRDSDGCFAKGTLVRTPRGMFPIESLVTGEEVLTHDSRIARIHKAHVARATELVRNYDYSIAQVLRVEKIEQGVANDVYNLSLERDVGFFANGKLVEAPHANRILDTRSLLTRAS